MNVLSAPPVETLISYIEFRCLMSISSVLIFGNFVSNNVSDSYFLCSLQQRNFVAVLLFGFTDQLGQYN